MPMYDRILLFSDGAAKGNPGPAGYGVRIEAPDGTVCAELKGSLGETTNNVAEYRGLIAALTHLVQTGARRVTVRSDSLLLVRQMRGEYRVRHPALQELNGEARALAARLDQVHFEHVPRTLNTAADRLANLAMDEMDEDEGEGRNDTSDMPT